ncbi:galactokinase [Shewanella sp. 3B26]|uniref:Galactokinase n=1 Tax=Shewanella zhuhaiensis TaxID=2919576 RepID=A0AAJ1F0N8_9GAMM|nr:galactokinase [Shewanella zhuhaiensis]MCH4295386.1 galactokinase [Shewanella zhuhaiensis]
MQPIRNLFEQHFGTSPQWLGRAPGRVNLIGEHTDYNDGFVLPCAIDFFTEVAIRCIDGTEVRVFAANEAEHSDDRFELDAITADVNVQWRNYVRGMVLMLGRAAAHQGRRLGGMEIAIHGNVPQGGGLSSSAALELALGCAINAAFSLGLSPTELAKLGQACENQFVGCNCGIMDQLISASANSQHLSLIDCRNLETRSVPLPTGYKLLIINSNVRRGLVDGEYNLRRAQCETAASHYGVRALRDLSLEQLFADADGLDATAFRRARHVVSENLRTLACAEALNQQDMQRVFKLMSESHASMRDDFEITVPAIDALVEIVSDALKGQGGVRMTGGGFGGCVVALLPDALLEPVKACVSKAYPEQTGLVPVFIETGAATGAQAQPII